MRAWVRGAVLSLCAGAGHAEGTDGITSDDLRRDGWRLVSLAVIPVEAANWDEHVDGRLITRPAGVAALTTWEAPAADRHVQCVVRPTADGSVARCFGR